MTQEHMCRAPWKVMQAQSLTIRFYGDPCLRKKSDPVRSVGPAERMLIASMIKTMHENRGVGLAAPQVGVNEQIFVVDVGEGPMAMVNPKIRKRSGSDVMEEGCLSIPEVQVKVRRAAEVTVHYLDEQGQSRQMECADLLARVVQHEYDHLQGKLITDYASLPKKMQLKKQLKALEQRNRVPMS